MKAPAEVASATMQIGILRAKTDIREKVHPIILLPTPPRAVAACWRYGLNAASFSTWSTA